MFKENTNSVIMKSTSTFFEMTKGMYIIDLDHLPLEFMNNDISVHIKKDEVDYCAHPTRTQWVISGVNGFIINELKELGIPFKLATGMTMDDIVIALHSMDDLKELHESIKTNQWALRLGMEYIHNNQEKIHYKDRRIDNSIMLGAHTNTASNNIPVITTSLWTNTPNDEFIAHVEEKWNMVGRLVDNKFDAMILVMSDFDSTFKTFKELKESGIRSNCVYFDIILDDSRQSIDEMNTLIASLRLVGMFEFICIQSETHVPPFVLQLEL